MTNLKYNAAHDVAQSPAPDALISRTVPDPAASPEEIELAQLIVATLNLDVPAQEIDPDARLYREGLGLDSIDVLELALAISKKYGLNLRSDDENNLEIFSSLRSLNKHIQQHRKK